MSSPISVGVESVVITSTNGRSFDAVNLFNEVIFNESMYTPSINGSITISDDFDHWEILPIIGQEIITFKLNVLEEETLTVQFAIYKISDIRKKNSRGSEYTLYFVSEDQIINQNNRISRSFNDMKYSQMIREILEEDIETNTAIGVDETENKGRYVVPNITPFQAIRYICKKSVSAANGRSNYVFFQDRRGFIAAPLLSLALDDAKFDYKYSEDISNNNQTSPMFDPFSILKIDVRKQNDTLDISDKGFFASQLHTVDIIRRKTNIIDYDYFSEFDESKHMNKSRIYEEQPFFNGEGHQYFSYTNEGILENSYIKEHDNAIIEESSSSVDLKRKIQMMMFSNYILNIAIIGNPYLFIGDVINIYIPAAANKVEDRINRAISGNNMVTSISHVITGSRNYIQRLETVKDSVVRSLTEEP